MEDKTQAAKTQDEKEMSRNQWAQARCKRAWESLGHGRGALLDVALDSYSEPQREKVARIISGLDDMIAELETEFPASWRDR